MLRVTLNGPYSTVTCDPKIARILDKYFAVEIPHARFNKNWSRAIAYGQWDGKAHFFNRLNHRLPTGLVDLLKELYPEAILEGESSPPPLWLDRKLSELNKLKLKGIDLSDFQKEAIRRALTYRRGILKMATNSGKTEVAAAIIKLLGLKTLYLIHRKELLHQTAERIKLRVGIDCGKIGDGLFEPKSVTVAMVQSLPKPIKANQEFYSQFDVLIMDECQHSSASTFYKPAMMMKAPWKFALSGTPFTGNDLKDLRFLSIFGTRILIDVRNQELIDRGWSAKPTVHLWTLQSNENNLSWRMAYDLMIVANSQYNERVVEIVKKAWEAGSPTLVLVWKVEHGLRLFRRLRSENIGAKYLTGSSESEYRKKILKEFKGGKVGVVIATSIFDEGVDIPAIQTLVLCGGGKSQIALLQRVGRALRRKEGGNLAHIHDFFLKGNTYLENHSKERLRIYEQEGFDLVWERQERTF